MRNIFHIAIISCIVLFIVLTIFLFGMYSEKSNNTYAEKIWSNIKLIKDTAIGKKSDSEYFHTSTFFLDLEGKRKKIETTRPGRGGGLTTKNDLGLVLTHDGLIYYVLDSDEIIKSKINAPDNNFSELEYFSTTPDGEKYTFNLPWYAYNDIKLFESENKYFIAISHTKYHPENTCFTQNVSIASLPFKEYQQDALIVSEDWLGVYQSKPCLAISTTFNALPAHTAGGRLDWLDGKLLMTVGDFERDGVTNELSVSQDIEYDYGKIISINIITFDYEIISAGHRNPQGLTVTSSNEIWSTEHGPAGGDELNFITPNSNYGWPLTSYGLHYGEHFNNMHPEFGYHLKKEITEPVFAWTRSIGISNLIEAKNFHPAWENDLLVTSLAEKSIFRLRKSNQNIKTIEQIQVGVRIRDIEQFKNKILLWTDTHEIFIIKPISNTSDSLITDYISSSGLTEDKGIRIKSLLQACLQCHNLSKDSTHKISLKGIFNNKIASTTFPSYSSSLRNTRGKWNRDNLAEFIKSPGLFAPESSMPSLGINDQPTLDAIVDFIEFLEDK